MRIKTFHAKTMAEALGQVKRQFGPGAVILSTRSTFRGGWWRLKGKPLVEITAARGISDLPPEVRGSTLKPRSQAEGRAEGAAGPVMATPQTRRDQPPETLLAEMGAIRSLVEDLVRRQGRQEIGNRPGQLYDTYLQLVENAVAEDLASTLVERIASELPAAQLADAGAVRTRLLHAIKEMLPAAGPIRLRETGKPYVVALIGPTGVGKTTTIAKLAANLCLRQRRNVGLITIDTYRIAAIEQLRTYAGIIDVPLEVATSAEHLRQAVGKMADRHCILIDTAGRGQRDELKIRELRGFFTAVRPDEIHLVLSSTASERVLLDAIERFREVGVDRVIFTKLDEAVGFGVMLRCLEKAEAALSYVTTGQDVPDDIDLARSDRLARLVLGDARSLAATG